jgi:hypothetical protein
MVREISLEPALSDKEADKLAGALLNDTSYSRLINYDADVYDKESGKPIAKFRKNIIPANVAKTAYQNLKKAAISTNNRNKASGESGRKRLKQDGSISNTNHGGKVNSGIIGYFDRNVRFPYCRQTAFNKNEFDKFKKAYGIIKFVDNKYKELMPKHYKFQRDEADKTSQDFVIKDTSFTTVTVNKNWQTAVHKDKGDYKKGFGNLVVLREGRFEGGYFVLPKWAVAFDMQNCDLLLVDVHQWHGNTPIKKVDDKATRLSLVMYYRKKMIHCGTAPEEQEFAKKRTIRGGESLF